VLSQHKPFHILIVDDNSPDHYGGQGQIASNEFSGRLFLKIEKESGIRDRLCSWVQVGIRE
jgi:dolichol-phosphate mannosyltransferase